MRWRRITIVGVGLLGGSLGMAIRTRRLAEQVAGFVRRRATMKEAVRHGAVDFATLNLREAVEDADVVILCTPITEMAGLLCRMSPALKAGALVTDVGSVKADLVRELTPLARRANARFVGSHPMAGSDQTGVAAASPDLFENAVCVVTPTNGTATGALRMTRALWRGVGARVINLSPAVHDRLVSRTSHLPHLVASALVRHVLGPRAPKEQPDLCATGFRDMTRLAAGSAEMWRGISIANQANLRRELEKFEGILRELRQSLAEHDGEALYRFLAQARKSHQVWQRGHPTLSPGE